MTFFLQLRIWCLTLRRVSHQMWFDQAKSVWSRSYSIFSFLLDCNKHLQSYILQKTPARYQQLKIFQNKRKQKEILCWLYLKINISDFRLILLDHITNIACDWPSQRAHHRLTQGPRVYNMHLRSIGELGGIQPMKLRLTWWSIYAWDEV